MTPDDVAPEDELAPDNVIPIRGGLGRGPRKGSAADDLRESSPADPPPTDADMMPAAAQLATELLREGVTPAQLTGALAGLFGLGAGGADPFEQVRPELMAPRADVVTYRVRVDLDGAKPPIWRRLDLPSDIKLDKLHNLVQVAMGWTNSHLHAFTMGPGALQPRRARFVTEFDVEEGDEDGILEDEVRLDQVIAEPGHRLYYEYDFGDGWDHTVKLEEILPAGPAACVAGRRACPPEDCGGVGGYEDILDLLAGGDPEGSPFDSREELLAWLPLDWAPDAFDLAETDELVKLVSEGGTPGLPPAAELNPVLASLLSQTQGHRVHDHLAGLAAFATSDIGAPPEKADIEGLTSRVQAMLDAIDGGVELTQAGYLPPAVVKRLLEALYPGARRGASREYDHPLVGELRWALMRLGLLHRVGRLLQPTVAGIRLGHDRAGLWRHIVERLPVGTAKQRPAGLLLLLALASGGAPPSFGAFVAQVLEAVEWGEATDAKLNAAITPTYRVLNALGCLEGRGIEKATDRGMVVAKEALRKR